jgi:hypothetical protein
MKAVLISGPSLESITLEELKLHLKIEIDQTNEDEYLKDLIKVAREYAEYLTQRKLLTQTWDYYLDEWSEKDFVKLPFGNLQSLISLAVADSSCVETNGIYNLIFTGANKTPATGIYTIVSNVITETILTHGGTGYISTPTIATQSGNGSITASMVSMKWKDTDGTETTLTAGTDYLVETNGEQCGKVVLPYEGSWPIDILYPSNPIVVRFMCGWATPALIPYKIKAAIKMICTKLYESRGEDILGLTISENKFFESLLASSRLWDEFL